jgi:hypothetical protein
LERNTLVQMRFCKPSPGLFAPLQALK